MFRIELMSILLLISMFTILLVLAVSDSIQRSKTFDLLRHQGFIQVKFHDVEIWVKAQEVPNLTEIP